MKMQQPNYIYTLKYDYHNSELCKLETRQLFNKEGNAKMLFSTVKIDPSISPFIKNRFEIISTADTYSGMLDSVRSQNICIDGFKVEYMVLDGDTTHYPERLEKLKDVGFCIEGDPDYNTPLIIYSICYYEDNWFFGILEKHSTDWYKHKQKPCSFSNSINMDIAKTLVSIASKGNKTEQLLDACCGVGTVLLEACWSGFAIEGSDINWKACRYTRKNLAHYNYTAQIHRSDICELDKQFDAAIIDLPYNLYTYSNDSITSHIIGSTARLTNRIVIVSIADISDILAKSGLEILDSCSVKKAGKLHFSRTIWVCEKAGSTVNN